MNIIVTDTGFAADDWTGRFSAHDAAANDLVAIDLPPDTDLATLSLSPGLQMIRISFFYFADGRGFTLARQLRLRGYRGRLRAKGHILSDQYAMARRAGFDEVEIDTDLAARQPESEWLFRANWRAHDYQARLRG